MEDSSKFVRGFSITAVGVVYSSAMLYVSRLVAINLLGPVQFGLYSLAFMVPSTAYFFLLFGLDVTAARYIAHNLGKNNEEKALKCAQTIFVVRILVTIPSVIVFLVLSKPLAQLLGEDVVAGIQLMSVYVGVYLVVNYLFSVLQGYFLIKERISIEAFVHTFNVILLVIIVFCGFGYISPILSFAIAFSFGFGLCIYFLRKASIPVFHFKFEGIRALREYLTFSFYVYVSDSFHKVYEWVGTIVIMVYAMPIEAVGHYRAMFSLTNVILLVSYGLTIVLYPMLSELNAREESTKVAFGLQKVTKITLALSIPAAFGMILVSVPLVSVFFPKYTEAVTLLRVFALRMIFLPLWTIFATALLTLGRAKKQALLSVGLCGSGFVLCLILGLHSVEGIALANTVALACAVFFQYSILKRLISTMNAGPVLTFCFSSALMCAVIWLILQVTTGDVVKVVLSVIFGVAVYSFLVVKTGAVSQEDLDLMQSGVSAFGRFGRVLEVVLDCAQKIQKW